MATATKDNPKKDTRIRMYFRCDPEVRSRFKAAAELVGATMEDQAERLMAEFADRHLRPCPPKRRPSR